MIRKPLIIAGPCSAESEEQVLSTARELSGIADIFRAGLWKPRTYPGGFEGVGAAGLGWLSRVREECGFRVATEVAGARHVEACLSSGIDVLWIGARTTANPFLVQEIADSLEGTDIPVFVKNPVNPDLGLWIGAVERLERAGVKDIGLVFRGFSTTEAIPYRNAPLWQLAVEMRTRLPELPFLVDPSHLGGERSFIAEISQRAMDLGFDGLMVEAHHDPSAALSDASQQITPSSLRELLSALRLRTADKDDGEFHEGMAAYRAQIDVIDEQILRLLASRMDVSRQIGEYKRTHGVAIVQTSRWETVLSSMIEKGRALGLPEDTVRRIFAEIHDASVRTQE